MSLTRAERDQLHAAKKVVRRIGRKARQEAKERRPVNPKASRGRKREPAFLAFLRRQRCAVAGLCPRPHSCDGPTQAAHIRTHKPGELPTGLQRKPDDRRATPLCEYHHASQHTMRELSFWAQYGLDPFKVAEEHYARFLSDGPLGPSPDGDAVPRSAQARSEGIAPNNPSSES